MKLGKCPHCGGSYKPGARFCPHCGQELPATRPRRRQEMTKHFDLRGLGLHPFKKQDWKWYAGLVLAVIVALTSAIFIVIVNQDYYAILNQQEPSLVDAYNKVGRSLTNQVTGIVIPSYLILGVALAGLAWLLVKGKKQQRIMVVGIAEVLLLVIGGVNFASAHGFSFSGGQLGQAFVKSHLNGKIYRYSYFKNRPGDDTSDTDDNFCNQIPDHDKGYPQEYSNVYLKFNSDGTLGVNVNPYWRDDNETAYNNSKTGNYRTVGMWHVNKNGKLHINWDQADTRAYDYEAVQVKVKKKHHKKHNRKYRYKTEYKWVAQYTDPETGDDDTSLPIYFPGDDIDGSVAFGYDTLKVAGVKLQKPNAAGEVDQ